MKYLKVDIKRKLISCNPRNLKNVEYSNNNEYIKFEFKSIEDIAFDISKKTKINIKEIIVDYADDIEEIYVYNLENWIKNKLSQLLYNGLNELFDSDRNLFYDGNFLFGEKIIFNKSSKSIKILISKHLMKIKSDVECEWIKSEYNRYNNEGWKTSSLDKKIVKIKNNLNSDYMLYDELKKYEIKINYFHNENEKYIIDFNIDFDLGIYNNVEISYKSNPPKWETTYIYPQNSDTMIKYQSEDKQKFYDKFKNDFINGIFYDLDENINYAFVLMFDLIDDFITHRNIDFLEIQFRNLYQCYPQTGNYSLYYFSNIINGNQPYNKVEYHLSGSKLVF